MEEYEDGDDLRGVEESELASEHDPPTSEPTGDGEPLEPDILDLDEYETEVTAIDRDTDRANAHDFVRIFGHNYVWTPDGGSQISNGWLVWDGRRWKADDDLTRDLICGKLADMLWDRADDPDTPLGVIDATRRRARRMEGVAGINGCMLLSRAHLVRSIVNFDKDPYLLNCPSGTLDLRTGTMREHRREDYLTRMCPTPYDPNAQDPVWNQVIWDAFDGDADKARYLCRFAGYSLTGETTEKSIMVMNGPTNTGKSTITEALYRVVGDAAEGGYATSWPADMIQAGTQVNRDYLMDKSRGSRMIIVAELERGSRMADSFVKQVSGGDVMNHRQVYLKPYDARPVAKLLMHSNYVPRSTDPAVHNRLKLLPFEHPARGTNPAIVPFLDAKYGPRDNPVGPDSRVKRHLETSLEARKAILAWAVRGAMAWKQQGMSSAPWMQDAMERYIVESDHVWAFVQDVLEAIDYRPIVSGQLADPALESSVHVARCWLLYQGWAIENVARPLKKRNFEAAMEERGLKKGRWPIHNGKMVWLGWAEIPSERHQESL